MKRLSTKQMVTTAVLGAIVVILGTTPLGLIPFPTVTATTLHIPVAVGAILLGPKIGLILGAVMGLTTFIRALLSPITPIDLLFINPLVSVLPRILMGLVTAYAFIGISKLIKNISIRVGITAAVASLANTIFTLGSLVIVYAEEVEVALEQAPGSALAIVLGIVSTSGVVELIITIVIVVPLILALKKALNL